MSEQITREQLERLFPGASKSTIARNMGAIANMPRVVAASSLVTPMTKPKAHKYRAQPTVIDGIRFASKAESQRYAQLKLMEKAGEITGLILQPEFGLNVNGVQVCKYVADFRYMKDGIVVIEDVKGFKTPIYRLKKKLFEACYNLKITEV